MSGYLRFKPTGNKEIDAILTAVKEAGDAFHNTMYWNDSLSDEGEDVSYVDRIQEAANKAALAGINIHNYVDTTDYSFLEPMDTAPKDGTTIMVNFEGALMETYWTGRGYNEEAIKNGCGWWDTNGLEIDEDKENPGWCSVETYKRLCQR